MNEALSLLTNADKGFEKITNEKTLKNQGLSIKAPLLGLICCYRSISYKPNAVKIVKCNEIVKNQTPFYYANIFILGRFFKMNYKFIVIN